MALRHFRPSARPNLAARVRWRAAHGRARVVRPRGGPERQSRPRAEHVIMDRQHRLQGGKASRCSSKNLRLRDLGHRGVHAGIEQALPSPRSRECLDQRAVRLGVVGWRQLAAVRRDDTLADPATLEPHGDSDHKGWCRRACAVLAAQRAPASHRHRGIFSGSPAAIHVPSGRMAVDRHPPPGAGPVAGTRTQARPRNAQRRRKATARS